MEPGPRLDILKNNRTKNKNEMYVQLIATGLHAS
jgi:hypothetical protein